MSYLNRIQREINRSIINSLHKISWYTTPSSEPQLICTLTRHNHLNNSQQHLSTTKLYSSHLILTPFTVFSTNQVSLIYILFPHINITYTLYLLCLKSPISFLFMLFTCKSVTYNSTSVYITSVYSAKYIICSVFSDQYYSCLEKP
jgi:hypothetical protein